MSISEKLTTIAENEQKVYDAGKKEQYDKFWDNFQENGNRTDYQYAFSYNGWTDKNFKPKYNMQPSNAENMFISLNFGSEKNPLNIKKLLEERGINLDFSKTTKINYCFMGARISYLGVIDLSSVTNMTAVFANTYNLKSIEKIIVNENNVFSSNCFNNCYATHILFEGVIGSSIRLPAAPLDESSINSIIVSLKDFSDTGTAMTLTLNSNTKAKLSESDIATITQKGWTLA